MAEDLHIKLMKAVNKRAGEAIQILGSSSNPFYVENVLSTGLPSLDIILSASNNGEWGLPYGKIINVKAKPSVGKTTFLLNIAKKVQKKKGVVYFVESEHALDLPYAKKLGCNPSSFLISQPDTLEESLNTIEEAVITCAKLRSSGDNSPFVIMFDSFSGASPESEQTGSGGGLGEHARLASQFCRKITGPLSRAKGILIVVHQIKSKIGVMYGNPDTHIGGDAFNYHGSISITLYRTKSVKQGNVIVGHYGIFKTTKNKLFPPFRDAQFKLINGKGFDKAFSVFKYLVDSGKIVKRGGWYTIKRTGDKFQGEDGFKDFLIEPRNRNLVLKMIKEK